MPKDLLRYIRQKGQENLTARDRLEWEIYNAAINVRLDALAPKGPNAIQVKERPYQGETRLASLLKELAAMDAGEVVEAGTGETSTPPTTVSISQEGATTSVPTPFSPVEPRSNLKPDQDDLLEHAGSNKPIYRCSCGSEISKRAAEVSGKCSDCFSSSDSGFTAGGSERGWWR